MVYAAYKFRLRIHFYAAYTIQDIKKAAVLNSYNKSMEAEYYERSNRCIAGLCTKHPL